MLGLGRIQPLQKKDEAVEFLSWASGKAMSNYFTILDGQSALKDVYENDELVNLYPWLPLVQSIYSICRERKSIYTDENTLVPITEIESIIFKNISNLHRPSK